MKCYITALGHHPKTPTAQRPFLLDFKLVITGVILAKALFFIPAHAGYLQTNLVSNVPGQAAFTDPNLINPWGMAYSSTSPFWVSDNGMGVSTLYDGSGSNAGLTVTIPPPAGASGPALPTGQVFNGGAGFHRDTFLFATEDGTIAGWRGTLGTTAELVVDNSASGAVYKGLAIGSIGADKYLYAANFHAGTIDVYNSTFAPALPGKFIDPNLPSGYAPFNIQNIGGSLFVTYAQQDANAQGDVAGAGHGFVDVFDTSGNLLRRLASGGVLDSPWGLALAPADFGELSNDLLVGNFGDGLINAFDPLTGILLGTLDDSKGNPLAIDGLWALGFGNGVGAGLTDELFFTAGPNGETDGLFGKLSTVPEPSTIFLLGLGLVALNYTAIRRTKRPPS